MPGPMNDKSLGLIETVGLVGAIEACDAAAKTADVIISSAEVTDSALVTLRIYGDLGAVQAAVEAGARAAAKVGQLLAAHVIPNPDNGLGAILPVTDEPGSSSTAKSPASPKRGKISHEHHFALPDGPLDKLPVAQLRRYARSLPNLAIKGRAISRADKNTILREIKKAQGGSSV